MLSVEAYIPTSNQWVTRPSLNQHKGSLAGASLNDKLFAIGGGNGYEFFSEVEMFDPHIGKWMFTESMQQEECRLLFPSFFFCYTSSIVHA